MKMSPGEEVGEALFACSVVHPTSFVNLYSFEVV